MSIVTATSKVTGIESCDSDRLASTVVQNSNVPMSPEMFLDAVRDYGVDPALPVAYLRYFYGDVLWNQYIDFHLPENPWGMSGDANCDPVPPQIWAIRGGWCDSLACYPTLCGAAYEYAWDSLRQFSWTIAYLAQKYGNTWGEALSLFLCGNPTCTDATVRGWVNGIIQKGTELSRAYPAADTSMPPVPVPTPGPVPNPVGCTGRLGKTSKGLPCCLGRDAGCLEVVTKTPSTLLVVGGIALAASLAIVLSRPAAGTREVT